MNLQLRQPDFTTATRIAAAINKNLGSGSPAIARASSPGVVSVEIPRDFADHPVDFIAAVEAVSVDPDRASNIVVNERTGTIVIGKDVGIAPVSILHGALTVQIETASDVSQPAPLSSGETTPIKRTNVSVRENQAQQVSLKKGATVEDLVRSLIAIGSSPRDVISVLQNLRAAGAIDAEIEVI